MRSGLLFMRKLIQASRVSVLTVALAVMLFTFASLSFNVIQTWSTLSPEVEFNSDAWHVFYDDSEWVRPPEYALRHTPQTRASPSHRQIMDQRRGKVTWFAQVIDKDLLSTAVKLNARNLMLGWLSGDYEIWLNQDRYASGRWNVLDPIFLEVPESILASNRDLLISVKLRDSGHEVIGDYFSPDKGIGLATHDRVRNFKRWVQFRWESRPFMLWTLNLIIAFLFLFLWLLTPAKVENFYMASFALVGTIYQLRTMGIFIESTVAENRYWLQFVASNYEACFGFLLPLAFARGGKDRLGLLGLVSLSLPILISMIYWNPVFFQNSSLWISKIVAPSFFFFGASACFYQAYVLQKNKDFSEYLPQRIQRLVCFGTVMLAYLLIHKFFNQKTSPINDALFSGVGHFVCVLFFGATQWLEFRAQQNQLENHPVSIYHKRSIIPESLTGSVLSIDIRNSERIFQIDSTHQESKMTTIISEICREITSRDGVILETNGDGAIAFFENSENHQSSALALDSVQQIKIALDRFAIELNSGSEIGRLDIGFRAAVTTGSIKPIWQDTGSTKIPAWIQVGKSMPLVQVARILEFDRSFESSPGSCRVFVPEFLFHSLVSLPTYTHCIEKRLKRFDKHGTEYVVSVLEVQGNKPVDVALRALA